MRLHPTLFAIGCRCGCRRVALFANSRVFWRNLRLRNRLQHRLPGRGATNGGLLRDPLVASHGLQEGGL
jgi:hypothetical protein